MKKYIFIPIITTVLFACKQKDTNNNQTPTIETSNNTQLSSFNVEGKIFSGKVNTQYFGSNKTTDNFSIICQQDEPLTLLQATFANEKNAYTSNLKAKGGSYKVNEGEYDLTLTMAENELQYTINEKSGGSIKVEANQLIVNNIILSDRNGKSKTVSAKINF